MSALFEHPLRHCLAPRWATAWGDDVHAVWVEFQIGSVASRLRYIPSGEFVMGSPPGEAGRFEWEGPAHVVELGQGYQTPAFSRTPKYGQK